MNSSPDFSHRYLAGLAAYLAAPADALLDIAKGLGASAAAEKISLADLMDIHQQALAVQLVETGGKAAALQANQFLSAVLAQFAAYYAEVEEELQNQQKHNEILESRVRALADQIPVLVEELPAAFYIRPIDGDPGEFLFISPQIDHMLGFSPPEWVLDGELWIRQIHPDDRESVLNLYSTALRTASDFMAEYRMLSAEGNVVWIHDEGKYRLDPVSQAAVFFLGVMFDATGRKQAEHTATLAERERVARELHDAVKQNLFSMTLITANLARLWQQNPDLVLKELDNLNILAQGALAEMQTLLYELRPDVLTRAGLKTLLQQLVDAVVGRTGIRIHVKISDYGLLPPNVQAALYRITQEALNNLTRHAAAEEAWIELQRKADQLVLTIRDNGRGFDQNYSKAGMGLENMKQRAQAVGGQLIIDSQPDQGTAIQVLLPLPRS